MTPNGRTGSFAIVGIGCRFPGHANSPEQFWQLLCQRIDAVTEIPGERFDIERYYDPDPARPGKLYARHGGFIEFADRFDAGFFGISPREARQMDPQQRILLEVAWEALEDGGQTLDRVAGSRTGVFIGISSHDFADTIGAATNRDNIEMHTGTGIASSIAANRISYAFDLRGPSVAVDTACSSSLTAVHLACRSLAAHDCSVALAGGVNLFLRPESAMGMAKASMLSPDGRCKAFDARANGFVRGEGAGIVVLKRLADAIECGDRIYALIRGSAINQDGRTVGITVPNAASQEAMFAEVLNATGIAPGDVDYMEAHGTGTAVGDPVEAGSIGRAYGTGRSDDAPLLIGSVKTNIGHLEAAAGIAGLIKASLVLWHRQVPPNLHFVEPNPAIPFDELRLRVPTAMQPLPVRGRAAIVGVNSFGFGGANAHVLLQEAPARKSIRTARDGKPAPYPHILALSAKRQGALRERAGDMETFLRGTSADLIEVCRTSAIARTHFEHRIAIIGHDREELLAGLAAYQKGEAAKNVFAGQVPAGAPRKLAFVFAGMGPQFAGMASALCRNEPIFAAVIARCDALLLALAGWSVSDALTEPAVAERVGDTIVAQVTNYAVQAGLTALLNALGIEPDAVIGHSSGEIAAAHAAGVLTLEDGMGLAYHRGRLLQRASGQGRMLTVGIAADEAREIIDGHRDRVCIAAVNSPASVTLSGEFVALEEIAAQLEGHRCNWLAVTVPYHSGALEPLREEFLASLAELSWSPPSVPMASTALGQWTAEVPFDAEYWWRNIRHAVQFSAATNLVLEHGCSAFVEVGPHPVLRAALLECLAAQSVRGDVVATLRRGEVDGTAIARAVAALHTLGRTVRWQVISGERGGASIALPAYPWQREVFGTGQEIAARNETRFGGDATAHPLLGVRLPTARPTWQVDLDDPRLDYLLDHRIHGAPVFPATGYIEMALAASAQLVPGEGGVIERMAFEHLLAMPAHRAHRLQIAIDPDGGFAIHGTPRDGQPSWTLHAQGKLGTATRSGRPARFDLAALRERCASPVDLDTLYRALDGRGLEYRNAFRSVEIVYAGECETLARVSLRGVPDASHAAYSFHPALLDSALQALIPAMGHETAAGRNGIYLPASVARIEFTTPIGTAFWVHAKVRSSTPSEIEGDVWIVDDEGVQALAVRGLRAISVDARTGVAGLDGLYDFGWRAQRNERLATAPRALALPRPAELLAQLHATVDPASPAFRSFRYMPAIAASLNAIAAAFFRSALSQLGCDLRVAAASDAAALGMELGVAPRHRRLFARLLDYAQRTGSLAAEAAEPIALAEAAAATVAEWSAALALIVRCGQALPAVLRGEREAHEVLFSPEALPILRDFYIASPALSYYNQVLGELTAICAKRLEKGAKLRVLEIGAGTGGATARILSHLPPGSVDYCFTDVSPFFLAQARRRFADRSDLKFAILDIERNPVQSPLDEFDVVIAANVIHAMADVRAALRNVRQLLAPGGKLFLLEVVGDEPWFALIFGLLEGWWRFSDKDLRTAGPMLPRERWVEVLADAGFEEAGSVADVADDPQPLQAVIVAARPELGVEAVSSLPRGKWLIIRDRGNVAQRLADALQTQGREAVLVAPAAAAAATQGEWEGVAYLAALDLTVGDATSGGQLVEAQVRRLAEIRDLVSALEQAEGERKRLWLVTVGAQAIGAEGGCAAVAQSPVWGVGRVIAAEFPGLRCRLADLGEQCAAAEIDGLAAQMCADDDEEELAFRDSERFVQRIRHRAFVTIGEDDAEHRVVTDAGEVRLEAGNPGALETLALRMTRAVRPAPDEILVRVNAAGLNFKDVMHALGLLTFAPEARCDSTQIFGFECSGVVTAIGPNVTRFRPGDEVFGMTTTGALGSHARIQEQFAFHRSPSLSSEDAAGVLVPFMTAHHALNDLARIGRGERVLVHSATGGVGLAALQICRNAGAEIFATAGTGEKRAFLQGLGIRHVMDSRSLEFADRIFEITGGEGVDVVLNSLGGEAIGAGLGALRPFGRFVEIGKRDLLQNSQIGLAPFARNLSFFALDLDRMIRERPAVCASLAAEVVRQVESGLLQPLPRTDFKLSEAAPAFRFMAQGRHVGKIVLTATEDVHCVRRTAHQSLFAADATYLITGGLGGLGLATARWLVNQGARHLLLAGRKAAPGPTNQAAFDALCATGAQVAVVAADVAREDDVARILQHIARHLPPLAGVFHEAMVLDDQRFVELTPAHWERVLAPKIAGAWNLHRMTKDLDYFVMFSSVSVAIGTIGQANYAGANAFLDALACYRRARHMHGLSVAWGPIAEVGFVADHPQMGQFLERAGIEQLSPAIAFTVVERLLRSALAHAIPARIDWRKLVALSGGERKLVSEMRGAAQEMVAEERHGESRLRVDALLAMSAADRQAALEAHLLKKAARVLGTSPAALDAGIPLTNLGLDSLMAVELESVIKAELGTLLPAVRLLQGISIRQLVSAIAAHMDRAQPAPSPPQAEAPSVVPLSPTQRRFWFLQQAEPASVAYNMPIAIRLTGEVDVPALQAALNEVMRRQPALRVRFSLEDGQPVQCIAPGGTLPLPLVDIGAEADPEEALARLTAEAARHPFDLANGPLITARLIRVSAQDHLLLATAHHLVVDAWSAGIISRQAAAHYLALTDHRAPVPRSGPMPYPEYVQRQIEFVARREAEQLPYWAEALRGAAPLALRPDRPRVPGRSMRSAREAFALPPALLEALERLGRQQGATLFMTLLAAFDVLLWRHSGQDDFCVGSPVASRSADEVRELVGCFVNTIALRARLSSAMAFSELLGTTRETVLAAFQHQEIPWERVVEHLNPARGEGSLPVFQTLFVLHNFPMVSGAIPGLTMASSLPATGASAFDLVALIDSGERRAALEYSIALFDAATIRRMIDDFLGILEAIAADSGLRLASLPPLREADRQRVLVEWNTSTPLPAADSCLHQLFEARARQTPEAIAIVCDDARITYRTLDQRASCLARVLAGHGVGRESRVAIALERSPAAIIVMLGCLKAGAAFLPLDLDAPDARLRALLEDAAPQLTLTTGRYAERFDGVPTWIIDDDGVLDMPSGAQAASGEHAVRPDDLAYVMYTSGSTGRPKGVLIEHRAICNQVLWRQARFPLRADDAVLLATSLSFDPSVWEIFGPLAAGARIVIARDSGHEGTVWKRLIDANAVSVIQAVPSVLRALLDQHALDQCRSLRRVFSGGEPLDAGLQERLFRTVDAELVNLYGCTETAIDAAFHVCTRAGAHPRAPIGRAISNTNLYVLNEALQPVPVGMVGELYVWGRGVGRGYLNDPALTADRFIADPIGAERGMRAYRTGDLARWLPEGELEFIGRVDRQLKVRGVRIEAAEIEDALRRHESIGAAAVAVRRDINGDARLIAWVVPRPAMAIHAAGLAEFLAHHLPAFMLPSRYVTIEALPRTPSGKLDAAMLPEPRDPDQIYVAPRNELERELAALWAESLGVQRIGVKDNFFDHGGHSLLAVRIAARISERTGRAVSCRDVLARPTIEQFCAAAGHAVAAPVEPVVAET